MLQFLAIIFFVDSFAWVQLLGFAIHFVILHPHLSSSQWLEPAFSCGPDQTIESNLTGTQVSGIYIWIVLSLFITNDQLEHI